MYCNNAEDYVSLISWIQDLTGKDSTQLRAMPTGLRHPQSWQVQASPFRDGQVDRTRHKIILADKLSMRFQ